MSLRTSRILSRLAHIKKALQHHATILALPLYIRYAPLHIRPTNEQPYQARGETLPEYQEAEALAATMRYPIKEYGFDPEEEGTEREPSPTPTVEFTDEWDDYPEGLPPPIDTR